MLGAAVEAELTLTFGLPKAGLYTGAGIDHSGTVRVVDIGIPAGFVGAIGSDRLLLTGAAAHRTLPTRRTSSHKGTYGHVGVIAGSVGKTGAAALAALALSASALVWSRSRFRRASTMSWRRSYWRS